MGPKPLSALLLASMVIAVGACITTPAPVPPSASPNSPAAVATASVPATPTAAPATVRPVTDVPPCNARAVAAVAGWQGAGGSMAGNIVVYNIGWATCRLRGTPGVALIRTTGEQLNVMVSTNKDASGDTFGGQILVQGASARAFLVWMNWCGVRDAALDVRVTLPETGEVVVAHVLDPGSEPITGSYYPRCDVASSASRLSVDPFQAR